SVGSSGSTPLEVLQGLLTLNSKRIPVGVELVPNLLIGSCGVLETANPAPLMCRIEGREIAELHRYRTRGAAQKMGECDDLRIGAVVFPKGQFAVQVECNNQFIACPEMPSHVRLRWRTR